MPVHKVEGGWRWGKSGKVYPTRAQAQRQAAAIYAHGYSEDEQLYPATVDLGAPWGVWRICWDYDVPLLAGSSLTERTVYVQRGWDRTWRWRARIVDRLPYLVRHEVVEKYWLDKGLPYESHEHDGAHDRATRDENAAVRADGLPVGAYQASYKADLRMAWMRAQRGDPDYKTPPGLEPAPYEHPHSRAQREALAEVLAQDGRIAVRAQGGERVGRAVHPSAAVEAAYRRKLDALIGEMQASYERWVPAAYRREEPAVEQLVAQDATPAKALDKLMRQLARRWQRRFDEGAEELAAWFATATADRSEDQLRRMLRGMGLSVRMVWTRAMQDARAAVVAENVALIKSIPAQYHTQVQGDVMRSVAAGRDLQQLTADLRGRYGVTRRRAELIARDQNNKATADLQRVRRLELGIREAVWVHSGGGKHPRPSHVAAGAKRTRYSIADGWYDPDEGEHIHPGQLINCRCVSKPVIPGIED